MNTGETGRFLATPVDKSSLVAEQVGVHRIGFGGVRKYTLPGQAQGWRCAVRRVDARDMGGLAANSSHPGEQAVSCCKRFAA
jgi:hypothetical protein